jgi:CrcB protein
MYTPWLLLLYVALGGAVGAVARFAVSLWLAPATPDTFPWATFVVNLAGAFLLGIVVARYSAQPAQAGWYHLLGTGFCGAFTTFSTFSKETLVLLHHGRIGLALCYVLGSVLAGLLLAYLGKVLIDGTQW